jgi:hypothetical protein
MPLPSQDEARALFEALQDDILMVGAGQPEMFKKVQAN